MTATTTFQGQERTHNDNSGGQAGCDGRSCEDKWWDQYMINNMMGSIIIIIIDQCHNRLHHGIVNWYGGTCNGRSCKDKWWDGLRNTYDTHCIGHHHHRHHRHCHHYNQCHHHHHPCSPRRRHGILGRCWNLWRAKVEESKLQAWPGDDWR